MRRVLSIAALCLAISFIAFSLIYAHQPLPPMR